MAELAAQVQYERSIARRPRSHRTARIRSSLTSPGGVTVHRPIAATLAAAAASARWSGVLEDRPAPVRSLGSPTVPGRRRDHAVMLGGLERQSKRRQLSRQPRIATRHEPVRECLGAGERGVRQDHDEATGCLRCHRVVDPGALAEETADDRSETCDGIRCLRPCAVVADERDREQACPRRGRRRRGGRWSGHVRLRAERPAETVRRRSRTDLSRRYVGRRRLRGGRPLGARTGSWPGWDVASRSRRGPGDLGSSTLQHGRWARRGARGARCRDAG